MLRVFGKLIHDKTFSGCALQNFKSIFFFTASVYIYIVYCIFRFQVHYEQKAMQAVFGVQEFYFISKLK